jgi:hypothetical protein
MELAGLEPATSSVRSSRSPKNVNSRGRVGLGISPVYERGAGSTRKSRSRPRPGDKIGTTMSRPVFIKSKTYDTQTNE